MPVSTRICPRRGLYVITPDGLDSPRLLRAVEAALRGGAVMLQYRSKSVDSNQRREQASDLLALCERYQATVIVNDDPLLAQALGTGVHLGEHDSAVADARALLGSGAIIGASCYDDPARAETAAHAGADYIAFGAFFASSTKPHARRAST
jgi:thiamine-phosphate pyrophosphorylase